jgi:hypothetical protein
LIAILSVAVAVMESYEVSLVRTFMGLRAFMVWRDQATHTESLDKNKGKDVTGCMTCTV